MCQSPLLTNDSCYGYELREDDVHVDGVVQSTVEHQPLVDALDRRLCSTSHSGFFACRPLKGLRVR